MTLENVTRFKVPQHIIVDTESQLREAGRKGFECFVLWTGVIEGKDFIVRTVFVPNQTAYKLETGLCVRVEGATLHELNRRLYESSEVLGVQIHTHPTEAYHSETDDSYPIVTLVGGLSVVIPYFCREGFSGLGLAFYRLSSAGWTEQSKKIAHGLLEVII